MYFSQEMASRIKTLAKKKDVVLGKMLSECGLNPNTLNQISEEKGIASFSLAKIADYLDCSVDYLLCRTENPNAHKTHTNDVVVVPYGDEQLTAIVETYKRLDAVGKAKTLVEIDRISKEREKAD